MVDDAEEPGRHHLDESRLRRQWGLVAIGHLRRWPVRRGWSKQSDVGRLVSAPRSAQPRSGQTDSTEGTPFARSAR